MTMILRRLENQGATIKLTWLHFGVGAPPILFDFSGDLDVHWGYRNLTHGHITLRKPKNKDAISCLDSFALFGLPLFSLRESRLRWSEVGVTNRVAGTRQRKACGATSEGRAPQAAVQFQEPCGQVQVVWKD